MEKKEGKPIHDEQSQAGIFRNKMVDEQLQARDITDPRVIDAMRHVPRHLFANFPSFSQAYNDEPYPIQCGQTISQPYIVAYMTQVLDVHPQHKVLEIGTGSGYQTAVLAVLAKEVHTIERHPALHERAKACLERLGIENVAYYVGDGTRGVPEHSPYDRILITAAAGQFPEALLNQLISQGGVMVFPMETSEGKQELFKITTSGPGQFQTENLGPVRFVPLVPEPESEL